MCHGCQIGLIPSPSKSSVISLFYPWTHYKKMFVPHGGKWTKISLNLETLKYTGIVAYTLNANGVLKILGEPKLYITTYDYGT